jgi:hypothetical protein
VKCTTNARSAGSVAAGRSRGLSIAMRDRGSAVGGASPGKTQAFFREYRGCEATSSTRIGRSRRTGASPPLIELIRVCEKSVTSPAWRPDVKPGRGRLERPTRQTMARSPGGEAAVQRRGKLLTAARRMGDWASGPSQRRPRSRGVSFAGGSGALQGARRVTGWQRPCSAGAAEIQGMAAALHDRSQRHEAGSRGRRGSLP